MSTIYFTFLPIWRLKSTPGRNTKLHFFRTSAPSSAATPLAATGDIGTGWAKSGDSGFFAIGFANAVWADPVTCAGFSHGAARASLLDIITQTVFYRFIQKTVLPARRRSHVH